MLFSINAVSGLSLLLAVVAVIIAVIVWTRRPAPGASAFSILLLTIAVWITIRTFEIAATDFEVKFLLARILVFATTATSIMWLSFALDYTGSKWWRRPRNIILLLVVPLFTLITVLFGRQLAGDWMVQQPVMNASEMLVVWARGPLFWPQAIYIFSLLISGIVILWRYVFLNLDIHRMSTITILTGALLPIISHALMVLGYNPFGNMDITPFVLLLTAVIYTVVIFRFHYIDIVPVARTALVNNIPDAVLVLDGNDFIIEINPVAERIIGCDMSSAARKKLDAVWPELGRVLSQTDPEGNTESFLEASDVRLYFDISLTSIHDKKGELTGRLVILRDITERKLYQQQLETLYEEEHQLSNDLQEEIYKRNTYTKAIIHELNTPLTSILAASELLESEVTDKRLVSLVGNIRRSSMFLAQRIEDLVELAQGETGTLEIRTVPMDIAGLIHEVVDDMKSAVEEKGISLVLNVPELPMVSGDSNRLRQVLVNLIGNAVRYTEEGQITVSGSVDNGESVLVQVEDTGTGIDEERLKNLFDPYRRNLTEGEKLGGIGIGLALSKMIVELHNGRIRVESVPGQGSSFYFTIPLYREDE